MYNTSELLEVLGRVGRARVLVVGDVMLDRYWSGRASRLSPEAPVPVVALDKVSNIPGGAANVAANIAGLGAEVVLAGVTGDDEPGSSLRSVLAERRIPDSCLIRSNSRQTTTKTRVLVHNQQIARIDDETTSPLSDADEAAVCGAISEIIDGVDAVVLSDYAKGSLTTRVLACAVDAARTAAKPVIVDPKARDLAKYDGATLLTPNLAEALNAAGFGGQDESLAGEAAALILERVKVESLLVTLGEHGMKLFRRGEPELHIHSAARQVFDVTGAGDTVVAAVAAALAAGAGLPAAISLANFAAGLAVEKVGTTVVGAEELSAAIREQEIHITAEV